MSNVDDIKARLSIEEVVGQYVTLTPSGANLKARCPFHSERTPSFMVSPSRQTYHCFGCGVNGDIFSFIEAIEGVDFKGALKLLADRAGVELTYDKQEDRNDKDELFSILDAVTLFYTENLKNNKKARTYLQERGLTDESIQAFRLGFAPDSWDATIVHLKNKGFGEKKIDEAGLIKKADKGFYDRFRSRIMFPITDGVGRVVAFSGRTFEAEKSGKEVAKYINSPETSLYHKSKVLYGYDRARQSIRKLDFAILVEGQMDLLAVHQAGYTNTVALSGTALTPEHLMLLGRMSKRLVMALDADEAGIKSAAKSAHAALSAGFDVKIAALPEGSDPADLLSDGSRDAWKEVVKKATHIVDFLLNYYRQHTRDERSFKLTVEKQVLPYLSAIASDIDRAHFIARVATQLKVSEHIVEQTLGKTATSTTEKPSEVERAPKRTTNESTLLHELVLIYLWQKGLTDALIDAKLVKKHIEEIISPEAFTAMCAKLEENKEAAFRFEEQYNESEKLESVISDSIERLLRQKLDSEAQEVRSALERAEQEGNTDALAKHMAKLNALNEKRAKLSFHL